MRITSVEFAHAPLIAGRRSTMASVDAPEYKGYAFNWFDGLLTIKGPDENQTWIVPGTEIVAMRPAEDMPRHDEPMKRGPGRPRKNAQ